jgi:hypothetical protein
MEKFFEILFDIKRIPTKLIFVLWVSTGIIIFVPQDFLLKLNLTDFNKEYGKYVGITFIISTALLVVTVFTTIFQSISRKRNYKKIEEGILKELRTLTIHEKILLSEFYIQNKSTLQLPFDNDTVAGLLNKRIIYQASSTGFTYVHGAYFPYSITEFALQHMTLQILDLPENPTEGDKKRIWDRRPQWVKDRMQFDNIGRWGE